MEIVDELHRIANENGGILRAEAVVAAARNKNSPLHPKFEWDDSEAAEQYRLWQARTLIRVTVSYTEDDKDKMPVRVFVSLTPDRKENGGGYRTMVSVMSNREQREQMLTDAHAEMDLFMAKYNALKELSEVFVAMKTVKARKAMFTVQPAGLAVKS